MKKSISLITLALPALQMLAAYETNFPADATIADLAGRALNGVGIGEETVAVPQAEDRLLYHDLSSTAIFNVHAGDAVTPVIDWNGSYMHGYFYIDINADGTFTYPDELVSYSYYQGTNSLGLGANNNCGVELPPLVIPNLIAGDYRARFIVDWDACDPGGRCDEANSIIKNAGAIADVTLRVTAIAAADPAYPVNYPDDTTITHSSRCLHSFALSQPMLGAETITVGQADDKLLYHDLSATEITLYPGYDVSITFNWTGTWMNSYLYIDRADNGDFAPHIAPAGVPVPGSDIITYSHLGGKNSIGQTDNGQYLANIPSFSIPADLKPGEKYRARLKIDWDSADPAGSETILKDGGAIVDFTIVISDEKITSATITAMPLNGILTSADGSPLPETYAEGHPIDIRAIASLPGFETDHIIVRSGVAPEQTDTKITLDAEGIATIPAELVKGDVVIYAIFEEQPDSEWTKIWGDEFNTDALDLKTWSYHPRYSSTWNRYIAQGEAECLEVNTFGNGYYNSWCLPTDKELFPNESQPMISGAIYTGGKFEFHYGRIEVRVKTNPYTGNFPAFWLMPATNAEGGWPRSGEIDIWEQIDASSAAHSTIHSGWTGWKNYCGWTEAPKQSSPQSTNSVSVDNMYTWHYYALEWDADELRWYIDGRHTFTYKNMHYSEPGTNYTEEICWPFYKNFYVILNQSVGNGSWAASPDVNHSYLTQFDYVRAYQKKGENTYTSPLAGNGDDPDFYRPLGNDSITDITDADSGEARYYDLQGRPVANPTKHCLYIKIQNNKPTKIIY